MYQIHTHEDGFYKPVMFINGPELPKSYVIFPEFSDAKKFVEILQKTNKPNNFGLDNTKKYVIFLITGGDSWPVDIQTGNLI